MAARQDHWLLLIRELDQQHSGSGCCGKLGGPDSELGGAADFSHNRAIMERLGVVYRHFRQHEPALTIDVVDPRNIVWLYPALWRAAGQTGHGLSQRFRVLNQASAAAAVVLDGEVLFSGQLPEPKAIIDAITARLADSGADHE